MESKLKTVGKGAIMSVFCCWEPLSTAKFHSSNSGNVLSARSVSLSLSTFSYLYLILDI